MKFFSGVIPALILLNLFAGAAGGNISIKIEDPGVQHSTVPFAYKGLETFDMFDENYHGEIVSQLGLSPGNLTATFRKLNTYLTFADRK